MVPGAGLQVKICSQMTFYEVFLCFSYACIARNCAACPLLVCGVCGTHFCYHCKAEWHPSQTCDEARIARGMNCNANLVKITLKTLVGAQSVHDIIQTAGSSQGSGIMRKKVV